MTSAILKALAVSLIWGGLCTGCSAAETVEQGTRYIIEADLEESAAQTDQTGEASIDDVVAAIDKRFKAVGAMDIEVNVISGNRLVVDVPDELGSDALLTALGVGDELELRVLAPAMRSETGASSRKRETETIPIEGEPLTAEIYASPAMPGRHIVYAAPFGDAITEEAVVRVQFDEKGTEMLAHISTEHVGSRLAIVLKGEIVAAPLMAEPILNGSIQIAGRFTMAEAHRLAVQIRYGASHSPFKIIDKHRLQ